MSDGIRIQYFIDGNLNEARTREVVPRIGDLVRLRGISYRVGEVTWLEDGKSPGTVEVNLHQV